MFKSFMTSASEGRLANKTAAPPQKASVYIRCLGMSGSICFNIVCLLENPPLVAPSLPFETDPLNPF